MGKNTHSVGALTKSKRGIKKQVHITYMILKELQLNENAALYFSLKKEISKIYLT